MNQKLDHIDKSVYEGIKCEQTIDIHLFLLRIISLNDKGIVCIETRCWYKENNLHY